MGIRTDLSEVILWLRYRYSIRYMRSQITVEVIMGSLSNHGNRKADPEAEIALNNTKGRSLACWRVGSHSRNLRARTPRRSAGVVCALELERKRDGKLGDWPIEIGLWVGGAATPNRFGSSKDTHDSTLVSWLKKMRTQKGPTPLPLSVCPWCGSKLVPRESFKAHPTEKTPRGLDVCCDDLDCDFHGTRLPIVTVDEDVYRRLPAFMIATVDKFASMPWEGRTGSFFGHVERYDDEGFYGPTERGIPPLPVGRELSAD